MHRRDLLKSAVAAGVGVMSAEMLPVEARRAGQPGRRPTGAADYETFDLGDFPLLSGEVLRSASLAYQTHGELNTARDNVIVYPTWYAGRHTNNAGSIGEDLALDPSRYFIVVPDQFGNGLSSSPSNNPAPQDRMRFPLVHPYDNVQAQHRLLTERYGIDRIKLVVGFSMSGQQAFHWGALYPDMVERIAPICGSAKTAVHNFVFLEGIKAALTADCAWAGGEYTSPPVAGLRAVDELLECRPTMSVSPDASERGPFRAIIRPSAEVNIGVGGVEPETWLHQPPVRWERCYVIVTISDGHRVRLRCPLTWRVRDRVRANH